MEAVYNKTLTKLFNGAKNASNNNLQGVENSVIKIPQRNDRYQATFPCWSPYLKTPLFQANQLGK